ncbi:MAG: alpha/beta hydrolase [Acidimicrobiales bacterium]
MIARRLDVPPELTADAVETLIAGRELPIVTPMACTFVYRGEADAVRLRHWGVGLPPDLGFERVAGSDLWVLVLELPRGSRVEYKFEVAEHGGVRLVEDPLNQQRASNPFGGNSVCQADGYTVPDWAMRDPEARGGRLEDRPVESRALGRTAGVTLYLPAGFEERPEHPYRLLVVHDGGDYLHYASLTTVLDNLVHRRLVPPLVAACLHPGERLVEYADDERHARFLNEELIPDLESQLPLVRTPAGRCLMGASFGAVASLAAAAHSPGRYGRLLLQSGSFAWSSNGCSSRREVIWQPIKEFVDRYASSPARVSDRVFVTCGVYESLICENRALLPALEATGMEVRFVEALDGHNWESWRDRLGDALPWLFDGTS